MLQTALQRLSVIGCQVRRPAAGMGQVLLLSVVDEGARHGGRSQKDTQRHQPLMRAKWGRFKIR